MSAIKSPLHFLADLGLSGPVIARCARFAEGNIFTSSFGLHPVSFISQVFMSGYELCQDLSSSSPSMNNSPKITAIEKLSTITTFSTRTIRSKETLHSDSSVSVLENKFHGKLGIFGAVKRMSLGAFNPKMSRNDKSNLNSDNNIISDIAVEDDRALQLFTSLGLVEQTDINPNDEAHWDHEFVEKETPWTRQGDSRFGMQIKCLVEDDFQSLRELAIQLAIDNATAYHSESLSDGPKYDSNAWFITGTDSSDCSSNESLLYGKYMSQDQDDSTLTDDDRSSDETPIGATENGMESTLESRNTQNQHQHTTCVQGHCTVNGNIKPGGNRPTGDVKEKESKKGNKRRWLWFVFFFIRKIFGALMMVLKYVLAGGAMALGFCEMICLAFYGIIHHVIVVPIYNWTHGTVPWLMSPASMEGLVLPAYSKENKAYEYQSRREEEDEDNSWFQRWLYYEDE